MGDEKKNDFKELSQILQIYTHFCFYAIKDNVLNAI